MKSKALHVSLTGNNAFFRLLEGNQKWQNKIICNSPIHSSQHWNLKCGVFTHCLHNSGQQTQHLYLNSLYLNCSRDKLLGPIFKHSLF